MALEKKDLWAFNSIQIKRALEDRTPFRTYEDLQFFAVNANLNLLSFQDIHGRAPHHPYENLDFQEQMAEGYLPRLKSESPVAEISRIHNKFLNTEEGKNMFNKDPASDERELNEIAKAVSGSHYNDVVPGFQYMQMMQHMLDDKDGVEAHLLGQVYKYLMRSGKKDDVEQEYRKARWYLNCLVKYKQTGEIDPNNND